MYKSLITENWKDYELIDSGYGKRLERFGPYIFSRPDPNALWKPFLSKEEWKKVDAVYHRSKTGGGNWEYNKKIPSEWEIKYKDYTFIIKPTGFKHMGIFPEQTPHWDFIDKVSANKKNMKILNLFAYTGGATLASLNRGAYVCHVDASKSIIKWTKQNIELSGFGKYPQKLFFDDAMKFIKKEKNRGNKYNGFILDPPTYGRGANGELWKIETGIIELLDNLKHLFDKDLQFFIINTYSSNVNVYTLVNLLNNILPKSGKLDYGDLCLKESKAKRQIFCNFYARWSKV